MQEGKIRTLQRAAEELRGKTQQTSEVGVHVDWDDLPGALALLQEVSADPDDLPGALSCLRSVNMYAYAINDMVLPDT